MRGRDLASCPLSTRERVRVRGNRRRLPLLIRCLLRLPLTPALSRREREKEARLFIAAFNQPSL